MARSLFMHAFNYIVCYSKYSTKHPLSLYVVGGCNVEISVIHRKCAWFMSFTVNGNKIGFETTKLSSDTVPLHVWRRNNRVCLKNNAIEPLSALLWYFKRFYMKIYILDRYNHRDNGIFLKIILISHLCVGKFSKIPWKYPKYSQFIGIFSFFFFTLLC